MVASKRFELSSASVIKTACPPPSPLLLDLSIFFQTLDAAWRVFRLGFCFYQTQQPLTSAIALWRAPSTTSPHRIGIFCRNTVDTTSSILHGNIDYVIRLLLLNVLSTYFFTEDWNLIWWWGEEETWLDPDFWDPLCSWPEVKIRIFYIFPLSPIIKYLSFYRLKCSSNAYNFVACLMLSYLFPYSQINA